MAMFATVMEEMSSRPNVLTATGEISTTGTVKSSATKNRVRMSRSMSAAIVGSDMSWPMSS